MNDYEKRKEQFFENARKRHAAACRAAAPLGELIVGVLLVVAGLGLWLWVLLR
jgi:hypothetical protein